VLADTVSVPVWQPVVDALLLMRADLKVVSAYQPEHLILMGDPDGLSGKR
jgi:hypothetical protein